MSAHRRFHNFHQDVKHCKCDFPRNRQDPSVYILLYMLEYCLWDLVDCMRREEEKIAGNTRDRGEKQGRARVRAGYFEPALVV